MSVKSISDPNNYYNVTLTVSPLDFRHLGELTILDLIQFA